MSTSSSQSQPSPDQQFKVTKLPRAGPRKGQSVASYLYGMDRKQDWAADDAMQRYAGLPGFKRRRSTKSRRRG